MVLEIKIYNRKTWIDKFNSFLRFCKIKLKLNKNGSKDKDELYR